MRLLLAACSLVLLSGCFKTEEMPGRVDRWSFHRFGGTLFGNPDLLTLKEIHLDTGTLTGREVIVEGHVAEVSKHGTYLVLKDTTARLLVVLTDMEAASALLSDEKPKALRVLGTVESGKKGLPYLKARSVNFAQPEVVVTASKT